LNLKTLYGVDYGENYYRNLEFIWVEGGGKRNMTNGVTNYQSLAITRTWTNTLNYNLAIALKGSGTGTQDVG
jgi:UDP-galactopyranose mutase